MTVQNLRRWSPLNTARMRSALYWARRRRISKFTGPVSGATNTNPVEIITKLPHGLVKNDKVFIDEVTGMVEINGKTFTVDETGLKKFKLKGEDGTGHGQYTGGGKFKKIIGEVSSGITFVDRTTYKKDGVPNDVPLPAYQAGDILVLTWMHNGNGTIGPPSGWTSLGNQLDGPSRFPNRSYVFYRVADGTEGTTVSLATTSQRVAATCYSLRGVSGNIEAVSTSGGDLSAEPPLLSPTWGEKETYWITSTFWAHGSMFVNTFPTDFQNGVEFGLNFGHNGSADGAVADLLAVAASEQPEPFLFTRNGADSDDIGWSAWTIAVEPAE